MATNLTKTLTDAGYIAVGLGVMGFQQAQARGRDLKDRTSAAGDCLTNRAKAAQTKLDEQGSKARVQAEKARGQAETQVRSTVERSKQLRDEVTKRFEPYVGQAKDTLSQVPERVVQAMEPVTARVRELAGTAA